MKRNGYVDVIKFFFAIMVAEFHLGAGVFPGGRLAVEGFFIITGYLMMKTIERDKNPQESLGVSTVKFMWRKYKALLWYLLPAAIISFVVACKRFEYDLFESIEKLPLLLTEIIPLKSAGFAGTYYIGISWYLASMFIGLAVLYPLCRKYKQNFSLTICPLIVIIGYGSLSHFFGNIAVSDPYIPETILNTGVVRGLAGMSLGCLLYEASLLVSQKKLTAFGRTLFTVVEIGAFALFIYLLREHAKDVYNFIAIFPLFIFLYIGINGISWLSYLWNAKLSKPLGIASTLIILGHSCWINSFKNVYGNGFAKSTENYRYVIAVALTCLVIYTAGSVLKWFFSKPRIKMFKSVDDDNAL